MIQGSKAKILFDCYKVPVLLLLTLFVRFMPYGFQQNAIIHELLLPLNLMVAVCAIVIITKDWRIDYFQVFAVLFMLVQFVSNLLNSCGVIRELWHAILYSSLIVVLIWSFKTDGEKSIKTISFYFFTILLFNMITGIVFPNGLYEFEGIRYNFIGNHNSYIQYALILLMVLGIKLYDEKDRKRILWVVTWIVLVITYYNEKSITSIVGLVLLFAYVLLFNNRFSRRILNIVTYTIVNIIVFVFAVFKRITDTEKIQKSLEVIGKSPTLTHRTEIWRDYTKIIPKSILLGFGNQNQDGLERLFSGKVTAEMAHAHNLFLNTTFQFGIIGLSLLLVLLILVAVNFYNIGNLKLRYYFEALLGVIILMSQFEVYSYDFYYMILVVMYIYAKKGREENEEFLYVEDYRSSKKT